MERRYAMFAIPLRDPDNPGSGAEHFTVNAALVRVVDEPLKDRSLVVVSNPALAPVAEGCEPPLYEVEDLRRFLAGAGDTPVHGCADCAQG